MSIHGVVCLQHQGGKREWVEIIDSTPTYLRVRWGLAGIYRFHVPGNYLVGAPAWHAENHAEVKNIWREMQGVKFGG